MGELARVATPILIIDNRTMEPYFWNWELNIYILKNICTALSFFFCHFTSL